MWYKMDVSLLHFLCLCKIISGLTHNIFHEKSKVVFRPRFQNEDFGFSTSLSSYGLVVGAPKARSVNNAVPLGSVYKCPLELMEEKNSNITCNRIHIKNFSFDKILQAKKDLWFASNVVAVSSTKLLICAPLTHYAFSFGIEGTHYRIPGKCYLHRPDKTEPLVPFSDPYRQLFQSDLYYRYGEMGISSKSMEDGSVIIGAPGLMGWRGGVVIYKNDQLQNIPNTYYTPTLTIFDYLGYSVESGVFQRNGKSLFVGGAPRGHDLYGQVLVFENPKTENDALIIYVKIIGPHLGSYFGASLCCTDIDGDGRSDLLVGAPTYVNKDGGLRYNQGAVFVYMTRGTNSNWYLKESGFVAGSRASGAQFGFTIAALGDIDGDGYKDVAIGAPWEDNGAGAVYIYKGYAYGLRSDYAEKIAPEGAKSFGISISGGYDVDSNNCNDLTIGAYKSNEVYLYTCIPTLDVFSHITIPNAMNLPENTTEFTVITCIEVLDKPIWRDNKLYLTTTLIVDSELKRARVVDDTSINVDIFPKNTYCSNRTIAIDPKADMSRPLSIKHEIAPRDINENSVRFPTKTGRISEKSKLHTSILLQLLKDCGDDLICTPRLNFTLEPLTNPYIPGTDAKLGFNLTVLNTEEPATSLKINITIPFPPKRVPVECSLEELNMICDIPSPLQRNKSKTWEIEIEYGNEDDELVIKADLVDELSRDIADEYSKTMKIDVEHKFNLSIAGDVIGNEIILVPRRSLDEGETIPFTHYYKIANYGPSNCPVVNANVTIPGMVNLSDTLKGCHSNNSQLACELFVPAHSSIPVRLNLKLNLSENGELLKSESTFNATTTVLLILKDTNTSFEITTSFILEPNPPIWPLIVGILFGLLIMAGIIYGLHKAGFFSREKKEELKLLKNEELNEPTEKQEDDNVAPSTSNDDNLTLNDL